MSIKKQNKRAGRTKSTNYGFFKKLEASFKEIEDYEKGIGFLYQMEFPEDEVSSVIWYKIWKDGRKELYESPLTKILE